jgi:hypothetical protein
MMKLVFTLGQGAAAYEVALDAEKMNIPALNSKPDENFISEIIKKTPGTIVVVRTNANGKINDAPTGEPGVEMFRDGKPVIYSHYKDGVVHGPSNGGPAIREFAPDGRVTRNDYYHEGKQIVTIRPGKKPKYHL